MDLNRISTEEFWNPEHVVEKFWNGLKTEKYTQRNAKNVVRLNFHLIMHVILVVITRQNGLNCPEKAN